MYKKLILALTTTTFLSQAFSMDAEPQGLEIDLRNGIYSTLKVLNTEIAERFREQNIEQEKSEKDKSKGLYYKNGKWCFAKPFELTHNSKRFSVYGMDCYYKYGETHPSYEIFKTYYKKFLTICETMQNHKDHRFEATQENDYFTFKHFEKGDYFRGIGGFYRTGDTEFLIFNMRFFFKTDSKPSNGGLDTNF